MALRKIVTEGDPILRKRARAVEAVDDKIRMILDDMLETMREADGCGIAAPQVGILKRLFIIEVPEESDLESPDKKEHHKTKEPDMLLLKLANPEILEMSGTQTGEEGCLSVPGLVGSVVRPEYIKLKALDYYGDPVEIEAKGFQAIAICHEFDHLEGVLFTDKATGIHEAGKEGEESASEK